MRGISGGDGRALFKIFSGGAKAGFQQAQYELAHVHAERLKRPELVSSGLEKVSSRLAAFREASMLVKNSPASNS